MITVVYNAMTIVMLKLEVFRRHMKMVDQGVQTDKMAYHSLILGHLRERELSEINDLVDGKNFVYSLITCLF